MGQPALFRRGRAQLFLSILLISTILLVACSPARAETLRFPTVTRFPTVPPRPTETRVPTVTPIPGGIPPTGELFSLPGGSVTRTPAPTFTLLPGEAIYDPLSPTQTAQAALPTQTMPAVTVAPEFAAEPIPTGRLTGGVLGLIPSPQGLWAMRSGGTQMTLLTSDPIDAVAFSPSGQLGLYLTHPDPNTTIFDQPYGYMVKLITLYDDRVYPVALIDPPGISAQSPVPVLDAAATALESYSRGVIAWSPNGSHVAFTSSHESVEGQPASSDIYLYIPASGSVRRLTQLALPGGPAHAYNLQWSSDSRSLYYAAAYTFSAPGGSGGTWTAGAWVAGLDGSSAQVFDGSQGGGINLLEWLPGGSLLVSTPDTSCAGRDLRMVRLADGAVTSLWPGCYADLVFDQRRAEAILSVNPAIAALPNEQPEGLYRVRIHQPTPLKIAAIGFEKLYTGSGITAWYGYSAGQGMFAITRAGGVSGLLTGPPYDNTTGLALKPLLRAAGGSTWLLTGANGGLYRAAPGKEIERLLDLPVEGWTTSPASPNLHFFYSPGEHGPRLYGVRESDWQPFPVDDRLRRPGAIRWVP